MAENKQWVTDEKERDDEKPKNHSVVEAFLGGFAHEHRCDFKSLDDVSKKVMLLRNNALGVPFFELEWSVASFTGCGL